MRIGIVDDTDMAVEALRRILVYVDDYQIIWTAGDGAQAVEKCVADPPDLVLMDLLMPVMDGVEATRQIMEKSPCGILIVTSSVSAHAPKVFEAMGYGALDAVDTPVIGVTGGEAATITIGDRQYATRHYRMTGELARELWYGSDGLLVKMRGTGSDGSVIDTDRK